MTVFEGYYDMEYPMMVNDSYSSDYEDFEQTENHEIAHTYFPFYMGTNESRYAFMDEGWATTFEYWMGIDEFGFDKSSDIYKSFRIKRWVHDPSQEEDMPVITLSNEMSGRGYGSNAYGKPSLAYLALQDLLGEDEFKKCMKEYISRWHGKHPIPWDFFYSFNDVSGTNLNWFWNNWFFSNNYIDLGIQNVTNTNGNYDIFIQNAGGFAIPFDVLIKFNDSSEEVVHQTPEVWSGNQQKATISLYSEKKIKSISLITGIFMDADESNNVWEVK